MVLRCLIVDDNLGFLRVARVVLEQEGLKIVGVALDRAEALRCVAQLRPDITLVDVDLGESSGLELVRQLSDDPRLHSGHLILISGYSEDDLADLIETSPAVGFLNKLELSAASIQKMIKEVG